MTWEMVIGLEVHCELKTESKLFCGCRNMFGDEPNTNICAVCLGLPGSLPVLNRTAVDYAMRIGEALHCEVRRSIFHRKNYFYPDMPKDYQVSQYDQPINVEGWLETPQGVRVGIERAHMEEDTGKTTHVGGGGRIYDAAYSLVDYNRAGVPLVEIVSKPDLRSADDAKEYVKELQAILVASGASDGKMEEGSLRVDANVSMHEPNTEFGTRCEIKNLNSLRSLVRAIEYEARRQIDIIDSGGSVDQETRHWNEAEGRTISGRSKEEAYDYRYFPEPDLVPLDPSEEWKQAIRGSLEVLPAARRERLVEKGISSLDVQVIVEQGLDELVAAAIDGGASPERAGKRAANEVAANLAAARTLDPAAFTALLKMEDAGQLTATQAKEVLGELLEHGGDPAAIAGQRGYEAMDSGDLEQVVDEVLAAHADEFERYKAGDNKLMGFFVKEVMDATGKKADGKVVSALLRQRAGG